MSTIYRIEGFILHSGANLRWDQHGFCEPHQDKMQAGH